MDSTLKSGGDLTELTVPALSRPSSFSSRAEIALHGVYEISKILAVPARLEETLSSVLALLSSFLDMHHGIIALLGDDGAPKVVVGLGWTERNAKSHFDRLPERAIGQIVTTKMPVVVKNVADNPLFSDWSAEEWGDSDGRVSFVGVPIKERDRVLGTLTLDRIWDERATVRLDEDVRFLVMIANLIGQTVRLHDVIGRDRERLLTNQRRLEKELSETARPERDLRTHGIVGSSSAIHSVIEKIKIVARSNSTVLLRGESGTGKELFARATHELSPRRAGPFVKLNCAALPETLLESELFGHEKGAFTGALSLRKGRFELAHGGTLFLDEIGEISPAFQAKLLRVLQEGEFERVGGSRTIQADVRLVTATNRNLEEAVARGEFRADLYYRINVVSISLPALRDRREDIALLAREFLRGFNDEHGTRMTLAPSAHDVLDTCYFPGNVRELENCIRRTATLAPDPRIVGEDFACRHDECLSSTLWKTAVGGGPFKIIPKAMQMPAPQVHVPSPAPVAPPEAQSVGEVGPTHDGTLCPQSANCTATQAQGPSERERLLDAMEKAGWVQAKAARLLNLTPRQVGYALIKHNVAVKKF